MYSFVLDGKPEERQIALVRNETEDVSSVQGGGVLGTDYVFSDERITAFIESAQDEAPGDANETEIRLMACGAILDVLATNQAFILKKQRTLHEETDGPAVGKEIRSHADKCRKRASESLLGRRTAAALAQAEVEKAANQYAAPISGGIPIRVVF